jgi:hypothetical protein
MDYLHNDPWYLEVNMNSAIVVWPLFNSLQAFWPGLQVCMNMTLSSPTFFVPQTWQDYCSFHIFNVAEMFWVTHSSKLLFMMKVMV